MIVPNFIVLEGGDGTGTSTQLHRLEQDLARCGRRIRPYFTCEPTDGPIGTLIRSALRGAVPLRPETVARLFAADRFEHLHQAGGILERCAKGELVVCDRYVPSSLVYQGLDCGEELPSRLNAEFPHPEMILYFDIDPQRAAERFASRPDKDQYERLDFQIRVHERYAAILPLYAAPGSTLVRIDASQSIDKVADQVWSALENLPILQG
jgi:dTMP kinase